MRCIRRGLSDCLRVPQNHKSNLVTSSKRASLTSQIDGSQRRRVVLITHANPQDNTIARWLAARLSTAGYKVWVDLRSLAGGNDFWSVIEHQLRDHAVKQIVLVSSHIRKPGVLKELALGDYVGKQLGDPDFMIPVRVTDVPHGEFPPELLRRNSFDAFPNWASVLSPLLETLKDAGVDRTEDSAGRLLSEFIDAQETGRLSVRDQPEALLTNWFPLIPERAKMRFFKVEGTTEQAAHWIESTRIPFIEHSGLIVTCPPETGPFEAGKF
ncbi:MAG: hypothetical protein CVT73_24585 [Alphaproteobacteria bacterium HGW-Alphaproteobacteria-12]|nr:MAG: hypothetical protein CVT73_24585 [Alphaproteobacteria bacterium HGW-Alphaproteobacteria-12]